MHIHVYILIYYTIYILYIIPYVNDLGIVKEKANWLCNPLTHGKNYLLKQKY